MKINNQELQNFANIWQSLAMVSRHGSHDQSKHGRGSGSGAEALKGKRLEDTLWLISEVPPEKREETMRHMGMEIGDVKAYHVTTSENANRIKSQGVKAQSSRQSYDRPAAVYLFLEKDEINAANKAILLDNPRDAKIIEVAIPRNEFLQKAQWDGLYNASFGESRSAIQFFGDVPKSWIKKAKK